MGFVREVELGPSFAAVRACLDYFGYLPAVYRAQSLAPRLLEAEITLATAVLFEDSALSQRQKERLLLSMAASEGNVKSATTHYEMLRVLGEPERQIDRILSGYRNSDLPPAEIDLLDFALKLYLNGTSSRADIIHLNHRGWTDQMVLETVLLAAWARFESCVAAGVGASPDFPPISIAQGSFVREIASAGPEIEPGPYLVMAEVSADGFAPFAVLREHLGFVPNIFRAQSGYPKAVEAEVEAIRLLLFAEEHLARIQKEQIVLVLSAAKRNTYFVTLHSEVLAGLGVQPEAADRTALEHRRAGLSEANVALLDFALKLADQASAFGLADVARLRTYGYTDEQILETIAVTGLTSFLNIVQFGIGAVPDFKPRIALQTVPAKIANLLELPDRRIEGSLSTDPDAETVRRVQDGDANAFEDSSPGTAVASTARYSEFWAMKKRLAMPCRIHL